MYLGYKYICEFIDGVVTFAARLQRLYTALSETGQKVVVQLQQAVQLGKQTVQPAVIQL